MIEFAQKCISEALAKWVRAQIVTSSSIESSSNYKPLTGDSVYNESHAEHIVLTIESDGKKATISRAYTRSLDPQSLVQEALDLLVYPTRDDAERLPVVSDTFSGDARLFDVSEGHIWQKTHYEDILSFMRNGGYGIENLTVSFGISSLSFSTTDGAKKESHTSGSSIGIALFGNFEDRGDAHYLSRDSEWLVKFDTNWIVQLQKELDDRLHHAPATFTAGAHSIALDPDTAASIVDEYMGLLSGYAIAEGLSPFAREALGSVIAPDGLTIKSLTHGEGLSETQYFDRNGITSLDLTVIEKGTLSTLFLSKASADRLGLMPNGQPNPLNVIVSGTLSENNLHGVSFLFTNLAGMHTIDSATGNFALEGEGYEIKNGKISHYVKNVWLSGNIKELFLSFSGILPNTRNYGSTRTGTLLFTSQSITPAG